MRIARAQLPSGSVCFGLVEEDRFQALAGSPFEGWPRSGFQLQGEPVALHDARLLAPVQPSKILAIGRNYAAHAAEHGAEVPAEPLMFLKPPSAIIGPGDLIRLPELSQRVEHEAELVVVIGRRARRLSLETAMECVLGFTCGNDVTARDLQRQDGQWSRAKGFDTFCPLGPWIETELNPAAQLVRCTVGTEVRQSAGTELMVFDVPSLLVYASAVMTLEPGDILMTGTPSGVGPLLAGQSVTVSVSGIGELTNLVTDSPE